MGAVFIVKPKSPKGLKLVLEFSGSFLFGITIFHLLPSIFKISNFAAGIWIAVGLIFQIFLEYLSEGEEHGHLSSNSKVKLPWVLFFSLCLHVFVEGIPMGYRRSFSLGNLYIKYQLGWFYF